MSSDRKVEYTETALTALRKLDKPVARRIMDSLDAHIVGQDAPCATGKRLQGPLNGLWRYRVGDMRVICQIEDQVLRVLVLRLGKRSEIYR
ncbi:addiction module toxin RelE [Aquaspirillum sp. LM1]|uniref:type II toxin-antitoxin system RelE family toxin n=1 Tax=Aquaspirillum sp. LM1 TaxID=1938604 RepID=UPI000983F140|nr:type II toxin-antitoxin system RelE/ParE family toxin [Aquaspirillum sp. LM1]AQR65962.1 addiction module toxin RelE [Aquaspirillum sp. LM1]